MKKIILTMTVIFLLWAFGCKDDNEAVCSAPPTLSAGDDISLLDKTSVTLTGSSSENK